MFDLHAYFIILIILCVTVPVCFFVDDLNVEGRAFVLEVLLLEEEDRQRRVNCDAVIGLIYY